MEFLSITWLFWIWITVALYWLAPRPARLYVLTTITAAFLVIHSAESAVILVAFTIVTALVARLAHVTAATAAIAITSMLIVLFGYKLNQTIGGTTLLQSIIIPLGLSYYTFRCIHVILERVKNHIPRVPANEIVGYLFFIPTIVVGPIHRIDDYRRDLLRQRFDPHMLSEGVERIIYGYAKITILSNYLVESLLDAQIDAMANPESPLVTYLRVVQNGLNLYFQFSGYSDIAIGFARLLGFRVLENFDWPYLKPNIRAFWRSWHISLTQWCRNYIYGSVVSVTRVPALGALATMTAIGLWHELSLRFLVWGLYHGVGIIVWQKWAPWGARLDAAMPGALQPAWHVVKVALTVNFVWLGFVILSVDGLAAAMETYRRLLLWWLD